MARSSVSSAEVATKPASAPLVLADAPFLLYRSFFALPSSIVGLEQRPVGALLGSVNVLLRVLAERRPRAVVVCFGAESAAYRVELYPDYHAARPPMPSELAWQFERAPFLFEALGWWTTSTDDLEADDLLGSYAGAERAAGGEALILTGDRDMYQCVRDGVSVLELKRGRDGFAEIDSAAVERIYGVPPRLVSDFIALRGDPSDGLPGASGIGAKTAARLLSDHGALEDVLRARGERPRIAAALEEDPEKLRIFREIATLREIDVELPKDRQTDFDGGARAAAELGMNALARRLENMNTAGGA